MRLSSVLSALAITSGLDPAISIDKSFSPKHPHNRLARLNTFCVVLVGAHFADKGPVGRACNNWSTQLNEAFDKKCGYYNPDIRNGGPNPDAVYRPPNNGMNPYFQEKPVKGNKKRNRRDTQIHEDWKNTDIHEWMDGFFTEECVDDEEDDEDCIIELSGAQQRAPGDQRKQKLIKMGPLKAAKAIIAGFRKYADRYLTECHGWRRGNQISRRYKFVEKIEKSIVKFFVCDTEMRSECADTDTRCITRTCPKEDRTLVENFRWGKNLKPYILG